MFLIECIKDNSYCIVEDDYVYGNGEIEEYSVMHLNWNGRSHEGLVKMKSGKRKNNYYIHLYTHIPPFLIC